MRAPARRPASAPPRLLHGPVRRVGSAGAIAAAVAPKAGLPVRVPALEGGVQSTRGCGFRRAAFAGGDGEAETGSAAAAGDAQGEVPVQRDRILHRDSRGEPRALPARALRELLDRARLPVPGQSPRVLARRIAAASRKTRRGEDAREAAAPQCPGDAPVVDPPGVLTDGPRQAEETYRCARVIDFVNVACGCPRVPMAPMGT